MKNILKISLFFTLCRFLPEWFTLGCHVSFLSTVSNSLIEVSEVNLEKNSTNDVVEKEKGKGDAKVRKVATKHQKLSHKL